MILNVLPVDVGLGIDLKQMFILNFNGNEAKFNPIIFIGKYFIASVFISAGKKL